jgi:hypothetical protein
MFGLCITGIVAVLVFAFFVSGEYQKATEQCEQDRAHGKVSGSPAAGQPENSNECEEYAERHSPGWYRVFRWTDGVTVWALILTLLTIAEQSRQTAISAKAAARGIEIQKIGQRAWLVIRSAMKDYEPKTDLQFRFWWTIENRGRLTARILETQCRYELVEDDPTCNLPPAPAYPSPIHLDGFLIPPEEIQEYFTNLHRTDGKIVVPPLPMGDLDRIKDGTLHLRVYGYVKYIDGLEEERESRFIEYYAVSSDSRVRGGGFRSLLGAPHEYTKCT